MNLTQIIEKAEGEFQEAYEEAYKDILPDRVLKKGNPWFTSFLSEKIKEAYEAGRQDYLRQISNDIKNLD